MDLNIWEKARELQLAIREHEQVGKTRIAQASMVQDATVQQLILQFQTAQSFYEDDLRYQLDATLSLRKLAETKKTLYEAPLVAAYLRELKKTQAFLQGVTAQLFDDLIVDFINPTLAWQQSALRPVMK